MLQNNDTIILKFYLHISHKEQIKKLKERIDNPEKHFKHNDSDRTSSEKFDKYLEVYDSVFDKCSVIPWHIIPSNEKRYKIYLVVKTIVETLEQYDLKFPEMEK
jgi:polyphosphate kinase 2 (PPK2 family)